MLLAQRKVEETKQALAIAYHAAAHIDDKGPMVGAWWAPGTAGASRRHTARRGAPCMHAAHG